MFQDMPRRHTIEPWNSGRYNFRSAYAARSPFGSRITLGRDNVQFRKDNLVWGNLLQDSLPEIDLQSGTNILFFGKKQMPRYGVEGFESRLPAHV